jgi:hypothetical protein
VIGRAAACPARTGELEEELRLEIAVVVVHTET